MALPAALFTQGARQRQQQRAGQPAQQLSALDRPGFFSRAVSDFGDVLKNVVPGLASLAGAAVTAPVSGVRELVDPNFNWTESHSGVVASQIGQSLAGTANMLFDDLLPLQYAREVGSGGDVLRDVGNTLFNVGQASPAGEAYRERLREHGRQFSETPASFALEHVGNVAIAGAIAGRLGQGAALTRAGEAGAAVRSNVRATGRSTYSDARMRAQNPDANRLARFAGTRPMAATQAMMARGQARTAGVADIARSGGPGSQLASGSLFAADVVAHPYIRSGQAVNRGLGRMLRPPGSPGATETLTGLFRDAASRPVWTQAASYHQGLSDRIQVRQRALDERIAELESTSRDRGWDDLESTADQIAEGLAEVQRMRGDLDRFQTQNADAIRRGQASLSEEGLATLHPLTAHLQRMRNDMSTATGVPQSPGERMLSRFDAIMSPSARAANRLTRQLRDDLSLAQSDLAARNTAESRHSLVTTELNRRDMRRTLTELGIDPLPRVGRGADLRVPDAEIVRVGTAVLDRIRSGDIDAARYGRLMEADALPRAVLSAYERAQGLPDGVIARQISDAESYSVLGERIREASAALSEAAPEALARFAAEHRPHAHLLENVPEEARVARLPEEIQRVVADVRAGRRTRLARDEIAKLEREQIPEQGTRTKLDAEGRRVPMAPDEVVPINQPVLSARQSRTYRAVQERVGRVGRRLETARAAVEGSGARDAPAAVEEIRSLARDLEADLRQLEGEQARMRARDLEDAAREGRGEERLGYNDLDLSMEPEYITRSIEDLRELYDLAQLPTPQRLQPGARLDRASSGELYGESTGPIRAAADRYARATEAYRSRQPQLEAAASLPETVTKLSSRLVEEVALFRKSPANRLMDPDLGRVSQIVRELHQAYREAGMAVPGWLKPDGRIMTDLRMLLHGEDVPNFGERWRSARRADGLRLGTRAARARRRLDDLDAARRAAADNLEARRREAARAPASDVRKAVAGDRTRLEIQRRETAKAVRQLERLEQRYTRMQQQMQERWEELINSIEAAPATARPLLHATRTMVPELDKLMRENGLSSMADAMEFDRYPNTLDALAAEGADLSYFPRVMLEEAATGQGHYQSSSESVLKTPRPSYMRRREIGDVALESSFDALELQRTSAQVADHMKREAADWVQDNLAKPLDDVLLENSTRIYSMREVDFLYEGQAADRGGAASRLLDAHALDNLTKTQKERLAAQLGYVYYDPGQIFAVRIRRTGDRAGWIPKATADNLKVYREAGFFERTIMGVLQPLVTEWKKFILMLRPGWHVYNAVGSSAMAIASGALDVNGYLRYMGGDAQQMVHAYNRGSDMTPFGLDKAQADYMFGGHNPFLDPGARRLDRGEAGLGGEATRNLVAQTASADRRARAAATVDRGRLAGLRDAASRVRERGHMEDMQVGAELVRLTSPAARRLSTGYNRVVTASANANQFVDNVHRAAVYLHQTNRLGQAPDAAIRVAMDTLGDYTRMSHVERLYIRNAIPFYAWLRHITRLMYRMHQPDSITRTVLLEHLTNLANDPREEWTEAPTWARADLPIPGTNLSIAMRGFNPFGDVMEPLLSDDRFDPLQGLLGQANPLIQFGYEKGTGIDLMSGRPFSRPVPVLSADGQEIPTPPPLGRHLLESFGPPQVEPLRNAAVDIGRWAIGADPELRLPRYGSGDPVAIEGVSGRSSLQQVGQLFGFNVREVDLDAAAERRANAQDRVVRMRARYEQELAARQAEHAQRHAGPSGLPGLFR